MQRRTVLKTIGSLLVAPTVIAAPTIKSRKSVLRIAHLTDVHLKDELGAPAHFRRCLHQVQSHKPGVDMILNGGDIVFDMNKESLVDINSQWQLWHSIVKAETSIPMRYALGNHDIWWNESNKGQAVYGKQYALDQLGLAGPYYAFVQKGWKFVVLDSTHLDIDDTWYIGKLGDAQFAWLEQELANTPSDMPVCVLPISLS